MASVTVTAKVLDITSPRSNQYSIINFSGKIRIQLSPNSKFPRNPGLITTEPLQINQYGFVKTTITGLAANTKYYARIISEDRTNTDSSWVGEFTTPPSGSHSFNFSIAACNDLHTQPKVWDRLTEIADNEEVDFHYQIGDWFYTTGGMSINDQSQFYVRYDRNLFGVTANASSLTQRNLWSKVPVYYQWDDHDYGGDNRDQFNPVKPAGLTAYRTFIPGPTLANLGSTAGVYYSWTRGRVRFVATDVRSERTIDNTTGRPNDANRYIFHPDQEQWFKDQITAAAGLSQAVVWVCTNPWIGPGAATGADVRGNNIVNDWRTGREWNGYRGISAAAWENDYTVTLSSGVTYDFVGGVTGDDASIVDHWGTRQLQRNRLADHITSAGMNDRVIIISGDMHGFAFDDGFLHTATGGFKFSGGQPVKNPNNAGGLKVCHVAPSNRNDGNPVTFFQDPWTTTEVDKHYSAKNYANHGTTWGLTGFAALNAYSSNYTSLGSDTANDSRGGPYYIGPISIGISAVPVNDVDWGLPGTTGDIFASYYYDTNDPSLTPSPTPTITSGYSIMNVTDLGGNTMGFRFRAVLTYPWSSPTGATVGPIPGGCPGTTCPEKTIIDQSWVVNIT